MVHYDLNVTYTFEPSMSSGDPKHDRIITLNIPFYVSSLDSLIVEKDLITPFMCVNDEAFGYTL